MEVRVIEKTKNSIKLEIKGERHTYFNLFIDKALKNENVKLASYVLKHPLEDIVELYIVTKKKTPKTVIKEIIDEIDRDLTTLEKKVERL